MKKLFLFLILLIAGITANAQYTPYNSLNYMKLLKVPPTGAVEDSVLVYSGSDSFVKMRPSSVLIGKATATKTGTVKTDITEADPVVYSKATSDNLLELKTNKDSGLLLGGVISVNADPTKWDLASGSGYITNSLTGVVTPVSWVSQSALTTPYLASSVATYVLINSSGSVVMQNSAPTQQQYRTHIYLGKLAHTTFTTILFAVSEPSRMFDVSGQVSDLNRFLGSGNVDGNVITYNGANLNINASAGMTYRAGANYATDRNSPSITTEPAFTAGTFRNKFRSGSGGWNAVNTTTVDNGHWDNGSGILQVVPNNKWTVMVFWRFGGTGTIHCDYGQVVYDNKVDALAAAGRAAVSEDPETKRDASRRAWLVVQQGITVLNDLTKAEFIPADKLGERSAGSSSIGTLQTAYNNSTIPQITTTTALGAVTVQEGTGNDANNIYVGKNNAGTTTYSVTGSGAITGTSYNGYIPENVANKATDFSVVDNVRYPSTQAVKDKFNEVEYFVEDYRNNSVYESIWLQSLIDSSPENSTFIFKRNTTYELNNSLVPKTGDKFIGNGAIIKRANESKTTLSASLLSTNSSFTVTSVPADWKINDYIHIFIGTSYNQSSQIVRIQNISGTTITLATQILGYVGSESTTITYPNGSGVRKVFNIFDGVQYPEAKPFVVDGVEFDGNKANNASNYYWALNGMINVFGYGGQVSNCIFKNVPNENITTSGTKIINNYAENLNGSFVHFSSPPISLGENIQGTIVANNLALNTNLINPSSTNHSISPLEISWNPGKTIISNNYFYGTKNGSVAYNFHLQNDLDDVTDRDELIISGNIFKNFSGISEFVSSDMTKVKSRLITGNIFVDCGFNNFNNILGSSIKFFNNQYSGDTSVLNLKQDVTEIPTFLNTTVTTSSDLNLVAGFSGLDKDGGVWLGSNSLNEGIINGYNFTQSAQSDLAFQRFSTKISKFFNRVLIDTDTDDGVNKLQVNGGGKFSGTVTASSATVSTELPTWGQTTVSPALTGTPTAPTAAPGTNTTQIATMEALQAADANNVKTTGNQSITGTKTFTSSTGIDNIVANVSSGSGNNFIGKDNGNTTFIVSKNGSITTAGSIAAGGAIRLKGYTVSTLPSAAVGDTAYVTDALAPTFLAAVVGGGSVVTPVFYNGSTWVSH